MDYTRALLEPTPQRLPNPLTTVVEEAIRGREEGNPGTARVHFDRGLGLAQEMGYL